MKNNENEMQLQDTIYKLPKDKNYSEISALQKEHKTSEGFLLNFIKENKVPTISIRDKLYIEEDEWFKYGLLFLNAQKRVVLKEILNKHKGIWTYNKIDYFLGIAESTIRFEAFLMIASQLKGKKYWYALSNAYQDSDNLFYYRRQVKKAFCSSEPYRWKLMNSVDRRFLKKLPETFTVYRGMSITEFKSKRYGISWSLKKEIAAFFASEYKRNYATYKVEKTICELTINKKDVIAFINERKEHEIIYLKDKKLITDRVI